MRTRLEYLNVLLGLGLTLPAGDALNLDLTPRDIALLRLLLLAQQF